MKEDEVSKNTPEMTKQLKETAQSHVVGVEISVKILPCF